nr:hypothetical protein [Pandoravirus aubagnensis]
MDAPFFLGVLGCCRVAVVPSLFFSLHGAYCWAADAAPMTHKDTDRHCPSMVDSEKRRPKQKRDHKQSRIPHTSYWFMPPNQEGEPENAASLFLTTKHDWAWCPWRPYSSRTLRGGGEKNHNWSTLRGVRIFATQKTARLVSTRKNVVGTCLCLRLGPDRPSRQICVM